MLPPGLNGFLGSRQLLVTMLVSEDFAAAWVVLIWVACDVLKVIMMSGTEVLHRACLALF